MAPWVGCGKVGKKTPLYSMCAQALADEIRTDFVWKLNDRLRPGLATAHVTNEGGFKH